MSPEPPNHVPPSSDEEFERLEVQSKLYGSADFLEPFLARNPSSILDVGCGTGFVARHVAAILPNAEVHGIDIDESRIEFARSKARTANQHFQRADLCHLPYDDHRFDLVYCRFVLLHYPDPVASLKEMARVTRSGGHIAAYDMIHTGVWFSPRKPAFERVLAQALACMRERGFEPDQGLHLPVAMIKAGLQDVRAQVIPLALMSDEPLFDAHLDNWRTTVSGLGETLGLQLDSQLLQAALEELTPTDEPQFLVEITAVAHGAVE